MWTEATYILLITASMTITQGVIYQCVYVSIVPKRKDMSGDVSGRTCVVKNLSEITFKDVPGPLPNPERIIVEMTSHIFIKYYFNVLIFLLK